MDDARVPADQRAGNTAMFAFVLAVVFVFLVLAAQFESLTLPLAVILIVPMCLIAAIVGVILRGHGQQHPDAGRLHRADRPCGEERDPDRGVRQAARGSGPKTGGRPPSRRHDLRLRPILMTSLAFIFGVVPLVWAIGAGAELRQALGTAVFSGMIGVTVFGLIFTPVFYVSSRWLAERLLHARRMPSGAPAGGVKPTARSFAMDPASSVSASR